jgi:hypothetical protein
MRASPIGLKLSLEPVPENIIRSVGTDVARTLCVRLVRIVAHARTPSRTPIAIAKALDGNVVD